MQNLSLILIRIKSWLNYSNQVLISSTFLGFHAMSLTFFGVFDSSAWFKSAHDSSSASKTWMDSTHDSSGFPGIDSELTMTQVVSPGIDSNWLMTQKCFPIFWFKSTHDSSEKHLILSRLRIRHWVIPTSADQEVNETQRDSLKHSSLPSYLRRGWRWGGSRRRSRSRTWADRRPHRAASWCGPTRSGESVGSAGPILRCHLTRRLRWKTGLTWRGMSCRTWRSETAPLEYAP